MNTILNKLFILMLIALIFGCSNSNSKILDGKWKEFWAIGEKNNVDYMDIYEIKTDSKGQIFIGCYICKDKPIEFQKIFFDGNELSFEIKWEDNTVPYVMKIQENPNILVGTAVDVDGKSVNVKFQKIE